MDQGVAFIFVAKVLKIVAQLGYICYSAINQAPEMMNLSIRELWEKGLAGYVSIKGIFRNLIDDIYVQVLFVLVYSLAFFNSVQWIDLQKPYAIGDDFPQHLLWLYKFRDNLFQPNDIYVDMSGLIQPWGYIGLNLFSSIFFDPITISKYFPVLLLFFTCLFTFLLLKKRFGLALAISGMILMSNVPFRTMLGFFARGFAFPLLFGFLYFWVERRMTWVVVLLVLSALFYPTICLVECGIIGLHYLYWMIRANRHGFDQFKSYILLSLVIIGIGLTLLIKSHQIHSNPIAGSWLSKKELHEMPEFQPGGRVDFTYGLNLKLPVQYRFDRFFWLPYERKVVLLLLIFFFADWVIRAKHSKFDLTLFSLLLSGTILFYLANLFLPKLFLPDRFISYTYLPIFYLFLIRVLAIGKRLWQTLIPGIFVILLVTCGSFKKNPPRNLRLPDYKNFRAVYKRVNAFTEPVLIAGPPGTVSHIPAFCRQSVLISDEAAHALYFENYYHYLNPIMVDFVQAYGATDIEIIIDFVRKYELDYILIDDGFFNLNRMWVYEPHKSEMKERFKDRKKEEYALMNLPDSLVEKVNWQFSLVDCKKLLEWNK